MELMSRLDDSDIGRRISTDERAVVTSARGANLTWFNDVAIVRSTFRVSDEESGQLMVVGPSRMNYERVVGMLDYVAHMIEKMYRRNGGGKT